MAKDPAFQPAVNIWNNIERCWVLRLDIVFEGQTITGIHNSEFKNITHDLEWLCKKLQQYKSEMQAFYGDKAPKKRSILKTYIYLLYDDRTGYYKIGRSINPKFREKTLLSERASLKMIWISPLTDPQIEKKIHGYFSTKRVRGEWFNLNDKDIATIKQSF